MTDNITFENLPQAVTMLINDISELKQLVTENKVQPTPPQEQFLTIQEASKFLNLSVPTMYSKVSKKELPVMKRGKRLYFSNFELTQYIKNGRKKSNAEIEQEADDYLSNAKKGLKQ